ncbi:MAG: hypothetical protein QXR19_18335 [Candidatus Jordarchaeaceae archaeon]
MPFEKAFSALSSQYFCEQKVDYEFEYGEIPTEEKEEGKMIHEEIIPMMPTTLEGLINSIEKEHQCICTFPVYARLGDVVIIGRPDAVVFQKTNLSHIIELKTTKYIDRIWESEAVQTNAYGLCLDSMGFSCAHLKLVIIKVKRDSVTDEAKEKNDIPSFRGSKKGDRQCRNREATSKTFRGKCKNPHTRL